MAKKKKAKKRQKNMKNKKMTKEKEKFKKIEDYALKQYEKYIKIQEEHEKDLKYIG